MIPIFLSQYRDLLSSQGKAAVRTMAARLAANGGDVIDYTPFEHIERKARLVLVGITPGPTQLDLSYVEAGRLIRSGASDEVILREAKRVAGFGGSSMRPNLIRMLNHFDFAGIFGLREVEAFWGSDAHLLHSTSVVPHAAFRKDRMFAGSFANVMASPVFRESFLRDFVGSIPELNPDARFIALGQTPREALDWCVANGHLSRDRVLGAFAHPSTNGGSAVAVYLGFKSMQDLLPKDPVRHRVEQLQADAMRMEEATTPLRPNNRHVAFVRTEAPTVRGAPTPAPLFAPEPRKMINRPSRSASPGDRTEIDQALADAGYVRVPGKSTKVDLFRGCSDGTNIYVKKGKSISGIVHPDMKQRAQAALKTLGTMGDAYHNSNMTGYPKRMHTGATPIAYGYPVIFETAGAFREFLVAFDRAD
jgi:hypothetical protein